MNLSQILLFGSCIVYIVSFGFHLATFMGRAGEQHHFAFSFMRVGFLISTFFFLEEAARQNYFLPVYDVAQALAFFSWSLAFVYLVLFVRIQRESFGLVLTPVLVFLNAGACLVFNPDRVFKPRPEVMSNAYFSLHVVSAFFAYACFAVAFSAGILYLIQHHELKSKHAGRFYHRLPSLEALEKLIFQPMAWGALLLALAVVVGLGWSKSALGHYGFMEPKTIATAVTAIVYFGILYLHYGAALRGKRITVCSLFAFGMIIFSFIGVRLIEGSHFVKAST